jgi:hypothetical protein
MAELDQLSWEAELVFECFGSRAGLRVNHADALPLLERALPPEARRIDATKVDFLASFIRGKSVGNTRRFHLAYCDSLRVARTLELDEAIDALETYLRIGVGAFTKKFVFLHAGAVVHRNQAIILPGSSHAGKSTLVRELVRRGASYLSDEYAVIDERGMVHPFATPLSIRDPRTQIGKKTPAERIAKGPAPLRLVILCRHEKGATLDWPPLAAGAGALEMMRYALAAQVSPKRVLKQLGRLSQSAQVVRGLRDEAAEAADKILAMAEEMNLSTLKGNEPFGTVPSTEESA